MVHQFLQEVNKGGWKCPPSLLEKFGENTVKHLQRQFERESREFTLRMSNIGQPLCILQMEKEHGRKNTDIQRFILGDLYEDVMLFILHAAKVPIVEEQKQVTLNIADTNLQGTLDIIVDFGDGLEVWDIKSASEYSFKNKFNLPIEQFVLSDTFGYVNQILGYASAYSKEIKQEVRAGGFIVGNKSSGEMKVYQLPKEQEQLKKNALREIEKNIREIGFPFKRQFDDISETWKKKPTGNRTLGITCGMCDYKFNCWPDVQLKRKANSTAKNIPLVWYTKYEE